MCAHYHSITDPALQSKYFAVEALTEAAKSEVWPGDSSVFIRRHTHADTGDEAPDYFDAWLSAKPEQSARFLISYPSASLRTTTL